MTVRASPLWVITTYYNPAGYENRRKNFQAFRKHIGAPLLVVELARTGEHRLTSEDGDIVLHLVGEDRLWQKERLLNLALVELPQHVEYVAWVDCDLIFEDEGWAAVAVTRLSDRDGLLQLFDTSVHLPRGVDTRTISPVVCAKHTPIMRGVAIASAVAAAEFDTNEIKLTRARAQPDLIEQYRLADRHNCYGMAWSARRDTITAAGFYDGNIVGGGDAVLAYAALNRLDAYWALRAHTPAHKRDMLEWAAKARACGLFASIDALDHKLFHLWHGTIEDRDYRGRYEILYRHNFDPQTDIFFAENGTWTWSDAQSDLARDVGDYFFSRREDGVETSCLP